MKAPRRLLDCLGGFALGELQLSWMGTVSRIPALQVYGGVAVSRAGSKAAWGSG